MTKKVLIIGGTGFIGYHVAKKTGDSKPSWHSQSRTGLERRPAT